VKLQKEVEALQRKGKADIAQQKLDQIEECKKIRDNLKKSHVSNREAREARLRPKLSTAKDITQISHKAGKEQAKLGAAIGGGISGIRNMVSVVKGEKTPEDAVIDIAVDTGEAALVSYGTAFSGSVLKGAMQNASSDFVQSLSRTNLPGVVVTAVIDTTKTMSKYFKGEIDGTECLTELGEKGSGMVSSAMFAAAGQLLIPIPVVGALVGGMVGYGLSSAYYRELADALKAAKLAREERQRIEAECRAAIQMILEYRDEIKQLVSSYLTEHITLFHSAFAQMNEAFALDDIDAFIQGANRITSDLGGQPQFAGFDEFDEFMNKSATLKL
jgi:hypothetical protein